MYIKRKNEAIIGRKLPEKLRCPVVLFSEIADDALIYSERHKRSYYHDQLRMAYLVKWFGHRPAESITPKEIEEPAIQV